MDMNQEKVNPEGVANSIRLLKTYLDEIEIGPLIIALEGLKENPDSAQHLANVNAAFNNLGISQGAVLTRRIEFFITMNHSCKRGIDFFSFQ